MRVIPMPEYGMIELSESEAQLFDLVSGYQEQMAVLAALKTYCNADKVRDVLALWGKLKKPHASYTLCPIISQIGERTPEQYIADVEQAQREYWERYLLEHPDIARLYEAAK